MRLQSRSAPLWCAGWVFLALYVVLCFDAHNSYTLLGDQSRDWRVAAESYPRLMGTPTLLGNLSIGPIYYWILWATYHSLGSFFHFLPHIIIYVQAFFEAASCGLLCFALCRKVPAKSIFFTAVVLFYGTSPALLTHSAGTWNPNFALAFVNISLALAILWQLFDKGYNGKNGLPIVFCLGSGWLACQSHSPALFFFGPLFLYLLFKTKNFSHKLIYLLYVFVIILFLQIPYLLLFFRSESTVFGGRSLDFVLETLTRFFLFKGAYGRCLSFLTNSTSWFLIYIQNMVIIAGLYAISFIWIVKERLYKNPLIQFWLLLALSCFLGFGAFLSWTLNMYLVLSISFPLFMIPFCALGLRDRQGLMTHTRSRRPFLPTLIGQFLLLTVVILLVPQRIALKENPFPFYGDFVEKSKLIYERFPSLGNILLPSFYPKMDATLVYECLGGKVDPTNPIVVRIQDDGRIETVTAIAPTPSGAIEKD